MEGITWTVLPDSPVCVMISVRKETHEEDLVGLSGRTEEGRIHGLVSQPWEGVKLLYS